MSRFIDWFNDRDKYTKATLQSKGYKVDVDDKFNNIDITDKRGRKYTVSTDDAMSKLIQQAYAEPMTEESTPGHNFLASVCNQSGQNVS